MISRRVLALLALLVLLGAAPLARADGIEICLITVGLTVVVDTAADVVADDGVTSLREAVALTQANGSCLSIPDLIVFDLPAGTVIILTDALLIEDDAVTMDGDGRVTLRSSATSVPLLNLVRDTRTTYLRLFRMMLDGEAVARTAPAIRADAGTMLLLDHVAMVDFRAGSSASGAIDANGVSSLVITDSVLGLNHGTDTVAGGGGAVSLVSTVTSGNFAFTRSMFLDNLSVGDGGAVRVQLSDGAALFVTDSTFAGNQTGANGGALAQTDGELTIVNSTFSDNSAGNDGGALQFSGSSLSVSHSTVVYNNARAGGGVAGTGDTLTGSNTILSLNSATDTGANLYQLVPALTHSLVDATADQLRLGALDLNGGTMLVHLLQDGSVAINGGSTQGIVAPTLDQRGAPRVAGRRIDIGAVEMPADSGASDGSGGDSGGGAPGPVWLLWLGLLALRQRPSPGHTRP